MWEGRILHCKKKQFLIVKSQKILEDEDTILNKVHMYSGLILVYGCYLIIICEDSSLS